jgi:glutamate carboxypeptidase
MTIEITHSIVSSLNGFFASYKSEILRLIQQLVEIESPSGDLEGSRKVVDLLVEEAQKINCIQTIKRIESPGYGEHLLIRAWPASTKTTLILGHTDTVHPRGTTKLRPWIEDQGKAYSPGIFDMKASCALALYVMRACESLNLLPERPIELLLTCDEETGSDRGKYLVEEAALRAKQVFVLEPPAAQGSVKTGRKGTALYKLNIHGRAAHAGLEPEKGASAILELARQIEQIHALNDPLHGTTINIGVIQGGTNTNVVPANAHALIDVRFTSMEEAKRIEKAIQSLIPFDKRVQLSIEGGINRPPLERTNNVIKLYEHARAIAAELEFDLGEAQVGGASDGNFVAAMGVPVLDGLGILGDGAHAEDEHIVIDSIPQRGALLAALIASL